MEEQPETPKILEELSRSNAAKPASRQQSAARRRFIIVLCIFSILLAGVVLLGYQQWALQTMLSQLQTQNQQLSVALSTQDAEIEQLRAARGEPVATTLVVDDTAIQDLQAQMTAEITRLRQQLAGVQQQQNAVSAEASQEFKLLEAQYLLGLANQKLQLQADLPSAIALLEQADAALVASGSNAVFATRQAIASDLQRLHEVTPIDRAGIYLRLDALIAQVQAIDLLESMRDSFQSRRDAESQSMSMGSSGVVDASLAFLSSVFVWRKWDETPVAMIAPGQDTLLKQNLRLILEQAQLALLLHDSTLYQRSLENSITWLNRYTAPDSTIGRNLLDSLTDLVAIDINPPLPSIEHTLDAVNQLTARER